MRNNPEKFTKNAVKRLTSVVKNGIVVELCQSGRSFAAHIGV